MQQSEAEARDASQEPDCEIRLSKEKPAFTKEHERLHSSANSFSRDDKTPIELFACGVRSLPSTLPSSVKALMAISGKVPVGG